MLDLAKQLFPTGTANSIPVGGIKEKLLIALGYSQEQAVKDADNIINSMLPDNTDFTSSDAFRLEQMLGMITNNLISLSDRKSAIIRKLNHPSDITARQSYDFLQKSLHLAGFTDIYVYETNLDIDSILAISGATSDSLEFGDFEFGENIEWGQTVYDNKIVNSLYSVKDRDFAEDSQNRNTFVIGGATLGSFGTVDQNRELDLRQLILKIKPIQTVGYLLLNYV